MWVRGSSPPTSGKRVGRSSPDLSKDGTGEVNPKNATADPTSEHPDVGYPVDCVSAFLSGRRQGYRPGVSGQSQGLKNAGVGRDGGSVAMHDSEVATIVPHGPADVILLERGAHVVDPPRTRCWIGGVAIGSEFVADERNVSLACPSRCKGDAGGNRLPVPSTGRILIKGIAGRIGGNIAELGGNGFRCGRVRDVLVVRPLVRSPRCALMGERI